MNILLIAKKTYEYPLGGKALTKDKAYRVVHKDETHYTIITDLGTEAIFKQNQLSEYFLESSYA